MGRQDKKWNKLTKIERKIPEIKNATKYRFLCLMVRVRSASVHSANETVFDNNHPRTPNTELNY